jgi:hypothetical protein
LVAEPSPVRRHGLDFFACEMKRERLAWLSGKQLHVILAVVVWCRVLVWVIGSTSVKYQGSE